MRKKKDMLFYVEANSKKKDKNEFCLDSTF